MPHLIVILNFCFMKAKLSRSFFARPAPVVARALIGMNLMRRLSHKVLAGRIVETEAYNGPDDLASHASRKSPHKAGILFGPPGKSYVYLIYGLHYCLNVITCPDAEAGAVLFRAVEPLHGIELMRQNRGQRAPERNLARGPGNLTKAFSIDKNLNGADFCGDELWIESAESEAEVASGSRIGVDYAGECASWPWRFWLKESPFVSKSRNANM